ncbi:MAG: ATP-binding protein [Candidatus Eisenbacteria bacterium]
MRTYELRQRILAAMIASILVLLAICVLEIYHLQHKNISEQVKNRLDYFEKLYAEQQQARTGKLDGMIEIIKHDRLLEAAWKSRDRTAVRQHLSGLFDTLLVKGHITQMYLHDPDRVNFIRVHNTQRTKKFGDQVDRTTLTECQRTGEPTSGIELGSMGIFSLRVVHPWHADGNLLGYIELTQEIDHIAQDIGDILAVDVLVAIQKEFLDRNRWQRGLKMLDREASWDRFATRVVIGGTIDEIPPRIADLLQSEQILVRQVIADVSLGDRELAAAVFPLHDVARGRIGTTIVLYDVSAQMAAGRATVLAISAVLIVVGAGLFLILVAILTRTERQLNTWHEKALEEGQARVALQEQLERARRMESLGILAGGVAHDLNNMLGPVVGYPDIILRRMPEDSPFREQIGRIGTAAQAAAQVIQDLLTLARRGRYQMGPTDLNEVVEAYLDSPGFIQISTERPDVVLSFNLDSGIAKISGSSSHLSKVVMNLVINAYEAMPDGGELIIETSQRYTEALLGGYGDVEPGDYIVLRIRDTGVGIHPDILGNIFEPYYSSKEMAASGSGLGLAVVYGIMKDHKGYYDVFSDVGTGTEFILYFPVMPVPAIEERETDVPAMRR